MLSGCGSGWAGATGWAARRCPENLTWYSRGDGPLSWCTVASGTGTRAICSAGLPATSHSGAQRYAAISRATERCVMSSSRQTGGCLRFGSAPLRGKSVSRQLTCWKDAHHLLQAMSDLPVSASTGPLSLRPHEMLRQPAQARPSVIIRTSE